MRAAITTLYTLIGVTCFMLNSEASVRAQDIANFAIEGHVFDAKNGRPISNVVVTYVAVLDANTQVGAAVTSDAGGFYQMDFSPPPLATSVQLFATCRTKKRGDLRFNSIFYLTARPAVYRRDFYITFPRGVSNCNP